MFRWSSLLALVAAAVVTLAAGSARADIFSDCGGAVFNGNETCTVMASASCDVQCAPPKLEVACSAQLEASCTGGCTATLPSCETTCQGGCSGKCSASGGNLNCNADCSASCEGNCMGTCTGQCATTDAGATCMGTCQAECKASCGAHCNVGCSGTPPMAGCQGECDLSCKGSCSGQANLNCDVSCQAMGNASCTASLSATCTGGCNAHTAIFCDGNFINATDANACVDDLKKLFNIKVEGWSYANSGCDGGTCTANAGAGGQASASCDMAPSSAPPLSGGLIGLGLAASAAGVVRRRRMRK